MATSTLPAVSQAQLASHLQTCILHDREPLHRCSGKYKKGAVRTSDSNRNMMPTCKVHHDQQKLMAWCRAPLSCGFECRRIYEWKAHEFPLCAEHYHQTQPCYLLKIPIEMRLRIWGYLLPDAEVPAKRGFTYGGGNGENTFRFHPSILRVSRQISEEGLSVLYGTRVFNVDFDGHRLSMCNMPAHASFPQQLQHQDNHALQDYQMQMMLLEQQNKKRLMRARLQQDTAVFGTSHSVATRGSLESTPTVTDPIWVPPLATRNFDLIQSFRIQIVFAFPGQPHSADADDKAIESKLYDYTDHLHRLIGRLCLTQKPIVNLQVEIRFENNPELTRELAFSSAQILLRPFRRLRNVLKPAVRSIVMMNTNYADIELLPTINTNAVDMNFASYVEYWFKDLSSNEETFEEPPVFHAYWQLKKLLSNIKQHCYNQPRLEEFEELLRAARIVREDDNLPQFRMIWDRVVNVWFDYLAYEKEFQAGVAAEIDGVYGLLMVVRGT
ncbi:Transcriptional activator somA [Lachnellula suecica]|uniref:Transcriptional activator somA n=1 Tax=Lachnellula suecica TaxID=602035 RepID=A0A8T9CIG1_9HELO|nr:Transcriptional activator somA [Lachnellula suecica]